MKSKQLTKSEGQLDLNWTKHFDYIFNSVGVDIETYDIYIYIYMLIKKELKLMKKNLYDIVRVNLKI